MAGSRITDLGSKEVINICDGARFGYVCDVEIDVVCGQVSAIVVPGPNRWKFWCREEYVIPWGAIRRIGEDVILVDYEIKREKHLKNSKKTLDFCF